MKVKFIDCHSYLTRKINSIEEHIFYHFMYDICIGIKTQKMHKTDRFLSQSDSKWWSMSQRILTICFHLKHMSTLGKHLNETSNRLIWCVYVVRLYLRQISKHRWMVSENTAHLSSSLTNSDWKSMSIRLTHNSECLWIAFISFLNLCLRFQTWPETEPQKGDHFSLIQTFLWL